MKKKRKEKPLAGFDPGQFWTPMANLLPAVATQWPAMAGFGQLGSAMAGFCQPETSIAGVGRPYPAIAGLGRPWPAEDWLE